MGIRSFVARHLADCRTRRLARRLQLDSAQADRLRAVHESLDALRRDAREGWRYQRQALVALLGADRLDRDEALRIANLPFAMINDALPHTVDRIAEFYDALSVEQRTRLRDLLGHRCCGTHQCHSA